MQQSRAIRRIRHGVWLVLFAAIAAAAVYCGWWRKPAASEFEAGGTTIVVSPLETDAAPRGDDFIAQGFADELTERLATIRDLRVIGVASATRAANEGFDSRRLRERLGATHLLAGRLRIEATRGYVEMRLVDLSDDKAVLTRTYDRAIDEMPLLSQDIALDMARSLKLPIRDSLDTAHVAPAVYRTWCDARRLADGRQRAQAIDMLRSLVATTPGFARAHAALARALVGDQRPEQLAERELEESAREAQRALELDPDLAEALATEAILACRSADWPGCMRLFERAIELDPSDTYGRMAYAYWLGALGFVERGLHQAEILWRTDPLSASANFTRGRLLDTAGRHAEAARYFEAATPPSAGLVYARWHNAVWRGDADAAAKLAVTIPQSDGFREAYLVVSEALIEPRLWPQTLALIGTSERATGSLDVLRLLTPDPDYAVIVSGLERMLRNGWPSYYLLLWMPEYAKMRRDPSFQEFLKRTHLVEYWRTAGWPPHCRAQGDGAACD